MYRHENSPIHNELLRRNFENKRLGIILQRSNMDIAIIGCGYSGLSAIRRCVEYKINCTCFELCGEVGGLWVYTDKTGADQFGVPIQTSLYDSVRTNSPIQTLEFPDFKFETDENTCYPRHTKVRKYLNDFAKHFNLLPHVKFYHYVTNVSRSYNKWKIEVLDLINKTKELYYFDAVMICNGHTTKPFIPKISGMEEFKGMVLHCHDYRKSIIFENKTVLVVGKGPSGIEIAHESSSVAKKTYLSQRDDDASVLYSVILKPRIKSMMEDKVIFEDGSSEIFDVVIFCTGYKYDYPFLDTSCGVSVEHDGQIVKPLYKHYINIEEPSMCFIGLFQRTIISFLFDFQVQAFLKFLTKQISLPAKTVMLKWLEAENERKELLKIPRNRYYHLSADIMEYFEDITTYANLKNIPPVLFKIFRQNEQTYTENFYEHRRWYFEIVDDYNYVSTLKPID